MSTDEVTGEKLPARARESDAENDCCPQCGSHLQGLSTAAPGETRADPCGCRINDIEVSEVTGFDVCAAPAADRGETSHRCSGCQTAFDSVADLLSHDCDDFSPDPGNGGGDGLAADGGSVEHIDDRWPSADGAVRVSEPVVEREVSDDE